MKDAFTHKPLKPKWYHTPGGFAYWYVRTEQASDFEVAAGATMKAGQRPNGADRLILAQIHDGVGPVRFIGWDYECRLALGVGWCDIVGPCEAFNPPGQTNEMVVRRERERVDVCVNGARVGTVFVLPGKPMQVRLWMVNCRGRFDYGTVSIPTGPRRKGTEAVF